jgi:bifunctional non-homologous end joining protein LigD
MPKPFPDWIEPMAATLTQERFTGPEWSFERKFDGIRLLAYKKEKQVELFSRNRLPQNLPAISKAVANLPPDQLILDGEITWSRGQLTYHVFDIMWIDGREVMSLPLEERRRLLRKLNLKPPLVQVGELRLSEPGAVATGSSSTFSSPSGRGRVRVRSLATGSSENLAIHHDSPWEYARERGWEGVIAKLRGSIYEQRRSRNWLKMKCELAQEFVVGGFTDPQGKRVGLGALLVGYYEYSSVSEPRAVATGPPSEPPAVAGGLSSPSGRGRVRVRSLATGSRASFSSPSGRGRVRVRSLATGSSDSLAARGSSPTVREGVSVPEAVAGGPSSPPGRGRVRVQSLAGRASENFSSHPAERESRSSETSEGGSRSAKPDFVFAGKIGTGFNDELLLDLRRQLDALEIEKPPFTKAVGLPRLRAHWVRPQVVVQVGFIQWTKHNKLRHPRLLGVRHDKDPHEVVRE